MPSKKVFDIIPPKESKGIISHINLQKKQAFSGKLALPKIRLKINKEAIWWPCFTILALIFLAGAGYFLIKPKAEISIWPQTSPFVVKTQVVVGNDIVGELKSQECSSSQEFTATGIKTLSAKSSGIIRVYNAYSTTPQTLIANTRFVSDGGKLFKIPQKIVIPGAHYEGSKLIPGELDTTVVAGEVGEEYNISPSTFSLPALAGTSRYTAFYARSFGSMAGGSKNQTTQVTEEDLSSAQESFSSIASDNCKKTLQDSLSPEEYIINEEAIESEILELNPLAKAGQEVDKFTLNIKVKAEALVFKKSDLENFAKTYIINKVPEDKRLDDNSVAVSYLIQDVDLDKDKIVLSVEVSAEIYPTVDENSIKEAVSGQRPDEVSASLKQFSEINDFQVRLWPFWVNKTPFDVECIIVKLRLD
ncbi:MAG: hypothetical protein ABIB55_01990 [Candidatus Nealsonbacteria bacterium]